MAFISTLTAVKAQTFANHLSEAKKIIPPITKPSVSGCNIPLSNGKGCNKGK